MAKKKSNDEGAALLMLAVGIIVFLPFLLVSVCSFNALKRQCLDNPNAQRVVDIRRLGPSFAFASSIIILGVVACAMLAGYASDHPGSGFLITLIIALCAAAVIAASVFTARHIAVLYLGIVGDRENGLLYLPFDMQSYTISDYASLRFFKDYGSIDSIPLSQIEKITRGQRGKALYVHGPFGSRGITMSNKQKRDECIAMIMSMTGRKKLLTGEIESV